MRIVVVLLLMCLSATARGAGREKPLVEPQESGEPESGKRHPRGEGEWP